MRHRTKPITSLILVGTSALAGCASVQTADQYGIAHGYQRVAINGAEYYCQGQPVTSRSKCVTAAQFRSVVFADEHGALGRPLSGEGYSAPPARSVQPLSSMTVISAGVGGLIF